MSFFSKYCKNILHITNIFKILQFNFKILEPFSKYHDLILKYRVCIKISWISNFLKKYLNKFSFLNN